MKFSTSKNRLLSLATAGLIAVTGMVYLANPVHANDEVTSNAIINRAGLTVEWATHSGIGRGGKLTDWHININENNATTFFTVSAGKYRENFSQNTISPFGRPYGIEGAEEFAAIRVDFLKAELENDGIKDVEIKVDKYTLPETTIYALTSNAIVKAIDGDSGRTKWSAQVGDPRLPSIGVGSSNDLVAALNGSTVYCLDASTGKTLWTKKCRSAPSAPPSVSDGKIFVPLLNGRLETFEQVELNVDSDNNDLEVGSSDTGKAEKAIRSYAYVSKGRGTARPYVTDVAVAWPTSNGDLNVAPVYGTRPGVVYQLRSDNAITSAPIYRDGQFFTTSLDGFVYALDAERGSIDWQISTGHSISQAPISLGNYIFVINDQQQMFKFDAKTGVDAPGWELPLSNVKRFIGAGKTQMYVIDAVNNLKVINQVSGVVSTVVRVGGVTSVLPNLQTDRLYVVSDRGMIQCIREIGSTIPYFHSNEYVAQTVDPNQPEADDATPTNPAGGGTDLDNPFGASDDPFGGGAKSGAAVPSNPFGGGAKTAKPSSIEDPFK